MLSGRVGAVFGFASHRSLAWGIADAWRVAGCRVIFALQNERFKSSLDKLTSSWPEKPSVVYCDAAVDSQIDSACAAIGELSGGRVDALLHSMAYATQSGMRARIVDCSREDYRVAHDISAYTLLGLARGLSPFMYRRYESEPPSEEDLRLVRRPAPGPGHAASAAAASPPASAAATSLFPDVPETSSIITLSYLGAERAVPGYRVMGLAKASLESAVRYLAADMGPRGVRVNALSAGPIDTLAARGIPGFTGMRDQAAQAAPLRRGITLGDVGRAATFLASDYASGVTGHTLYVDNGVHAVA